MDANTSRLAYELPFSSSYHGNQDATSPPDYSVVPSSQETRLQFTPRLNHPSSSDTYIQTSGDVVVSLYCQDSKSSRPSYGLRGRIKGVIHCRQPEKVQQVIFRIEGKKRTLSRGMTVFWLRNLVLWNRTASEQECPSLHPFSYTIPVRYSTGDDEQQLPPSYRMMWHPGLAMDFVTIKYSIYAMVTYSRPMYRFSGDARVVEIPFDYVPRIRAETPIIKPHCFFNSIKLSPEIWHQACAVLQPCSESCFMPVSCVMFLPNPRVYSLQDAIPFYIQLIGPLQSLRALLQPSADASSNSALLTPDNLSENRSLGSSIFSFYMERKTTVVHPRETISKETVLGEGCVSEIPPDTSRMGTHSGDELHLTCEGEIQAKQGMNVGSFQVMNVSVQDSMVLKIAPTMTNQDSPFHRAEIIIPITLVTDPYVEIPDHGIGNL